MSWRDQLQEASWRNVPFFVESAEQSGGRRGQLHEYPRRDEPFFDDTGRKARTFPIEGYVIGDDYFAARDALITALELDGVGELVHPYRGKKRGIINDFRVRESTNEGGVARFSFTFTETSFFPLQPSISPATGDVALASVADARSAATGEFLAQYNPGTLLDSVIGAVLATTTALHGVLAKVALAGQELALMRRRVDTLEQTAVSAVEAPSALVSSLTDILNGFGTDAADALLDLYAFNPGVRPPSTTSNRIQEQTNFDAYQTLVQRLSLMRSAELTLDRTFQSYDDAVVARSRLTDLLDEQSETAPDDTYPALVQLRAALVKAVPGDTSDLPHLLKFTPATTLPSLVLTHQLYGDVSRDQDLVDRNDIRNPLFVHGGTELEVLGNE